MPLTKDKATKLNTAIKSVDLPQKIADARNVWDQNMQNPQWQQCTTYEKLQNDLIALRKASLDRKSVEVPVEMVDGKRTPIRVFPPSDKNVDIDVNDIFARGIDSARAVTEILNCAPNQFANLAPDLALEQLTKLLNRFQANMVTHKANADSKQGKGMDNALKELARFNGALSDLLVHKAVENRSQANKAINFVRDYLWKKDICTANCVIEEHYSQTMLRYAEPMTFGKAEVKHSSSPSTAPIDLWSGEQPWKEELAEKVGGSEEDSWFSKFMNKHLGTMKTLSSTPMSRFTPNPANAFDCSDIIVKNDAVAHVSHHTRTAITEPLDAGATRSRQAVTDWNHFQLISQSRLEGELTSFMETWGPIIGDDPIPFTILHQTLIGDEVTLSPDQLKAKASLLEGSVIDSKLEANRRVREMLVKRDIFRNKETGKIKFTAKNSPPNEEGWQKVEVSLLETNNCINMWGSRARVRNNDVNDARQLIGNAVKLFQLLQDKASTLHLETVIAFLKSNDHSLLTPYKFRGRAVKEAVIKLTERLMDDNNPLGSYNQEINEAGGLNKEVREAIALSLQAAVELKCTVHETWFASARRNIANFTQDYVRQVPIFGHLADWVVRGTMAVVGVVVNILTLPFTLQQRINHWDDRVEMYKATYEGILAESLGTLQGGCMSSADRAGEMAEQRAAMKMQFSEKGYIISYNDSSKDKEDFYEMYGSTTAKHHYAEMSTGTAATQDFETRGTLLHARNGVLSHVVETEDEQRLARDSASMRKGKYDKAMNANLYLNIPAVGVQEPKASKPTSPPSSRSRLPIVVLLEKGVGQEPLDNNKGNQDDDDNPYTVH